MPLLPGNYCIFGATVFSTARIPPFETAIGKAGVGLNEIEWAAGEGVDSAATCRESMPLWIGVTPIKHPNEAMAETVASPYVELQFSCGVAL